MTSERKKVPIDEKLVKDIAVLARLDLTNEETRLFVEQFKDILDYVGVLNELDTENIPPAYLSSASQRAAREDLVEESVPTREFLANAPQAKDDCVVIPRVHMEQ
jgi:aspartyl/glutamyl-tRNA(Asn/Gln) amidotransferase C subunit